VSPEPCAEGEESQLAGTTSRALKINAMQKTSQLTWKARALHGRVQGEFKTGYKPMKLSEKQLLSTKLDTSGFNPPAAFDARDLVEGQDHRCKAYDILDQV
jgi:hypothetical protein